MRTTCAIALTVVLAISPRSYAYLGISGRNVLPEYESPLVVDMSRFECLATGYLTMKLTLKSLSFNDVREPSHGAISCIDELVSAFPTKGTPHFSAFRTSKNEWNTRKLVDWLATKNMGDEVGDSASLLGSEMRLLINIVDQNSLRTDDLGCLKSRFAPVGASLLAMMQPESEAKEVRDLTCKDTVAKFTDWLQEKLDPYLIPNLEYPFPDVHDLQTSSLRGPWTNCLIIHRPLEPWNFAIRPQRESSCVTFWMRDEREDVLVDVSSTTQPHADFRF